MIDGLIGESDTVTKDIFLSHDLNLDERRMMFAAVHRLSVKLASYSESRIIALTKKKHPNILVKFVNIHDRDAVIQAAMKHLTQGNGLLVVSDLPLQRNKIRQTLLLKGNSMSSEDKKKIKLMYTKFYPFVMLETKQPKQSN